MPTAKYLKFDPETGKISELLRQPEDRFVNGAEDLDEAEGGFVPFGLDPTKGQLLGQLVDVPAGMSDPRPRAGP